jgi:hypothetical protein
MRGLPGLQDCRPVKKNSDAGHALPTAMAIIGGVSSISAEAVMRKILLAGVACIALAGFSGMAEAKSPEIHTLTVQLPGGGIEQIRYAGGVAPRIVLVPVPAGILAPMPSLMPSMFGPDSPFAVLDRISAEMDRQAASLLREVGALAAAPLPGPGQLTEAAFGRLPPGSEGFGLVSTFSGSGVCTETMRVTEAGNGAPPHVVSSRTGDCGAAAGAAPVGLPVGLPVHPSPLPSPHRPETILASAAGPQAYADAMREAAAPRY